MATRGIMADNMFLSQSSLLCWLNNTLMLKLEKIEETCTGAVACQLMDILHPGSVNMRKVDFNVRSDWEYTQNYKELQQAFNKCNIDRAFSVAQLSKGKRQDNNEFMQWFKGYWDSVTGGQDVAADYDAVARRSICKTGDWKKTSLGAGAARPPSAGATAASGGADGTIPAVRRGTSGGATRGGNTTASSSSAMKAARVPIGGAVAGKAAGHNSAAAAAAPSVEMMARLTDLTEQVTELKLKVETAERERDFYFDKLRDIEILCQAPELADMPILKTVEKVLYAADSNEAKQAMADAQEEYGASLLGPEDAAAVAAEVAAAQ